MKEDKGYKAHKEMHRNRENSARSPPMSWKLRRARVGFGPMLDELNLVPLKLSRA